ncbi:MAG TPA: DUF2156 domain-containing protein [Clostridiaceae bacterium]|jgi:hypothetical protein|nr:DUF2156 domain-containing protein [Clostridiaceae bacterium]
MELSRIEIDHKPIFDKYFKSYNPQISEFTFTNLFIWRDFYNLSFTELNGFLVIIAEPYKEAPFSFMFVGDSGGDAFYETYCRVGEYFKSKGWRLKFERVDEQFLELLRKYSKDELEFYLDDKNSDYVYLTENLISLRGKKLHGQKNHVNRFLKEYENEYIPLTVEHVDECLRIMEEWCAEKYCHCSRGPYCEKHANAELLKNWEVLGCKGALIKVNGKFKAYTIGEMLNTDTAVIHIEKADSKVNGLYSFINQQFCKNEFSNVPYVNREQDMGEEGLRKAKRSYHPVRMVDKYIILKK